ncbi:hypothetical protein C8R44DRAFT_736041 [Mycena epipterygia]|nr:hypothetical protein C8R44DRAFT_736041 [Mycena epipterygia]
MSSSMVTKTEPTPLSILHDLVTTIAFSSVIILAVLRCIKLHLAFFAPTPCCVTEIGSTQGSYCRYQQSLDNISRIDVLKVTAGFSLVALVAAELHTFLARRVRAQQCDAEEAGYERSVRVSEVVPEKQALLENRAIVVAFSRLPALLVPRPDLHHDQEANVGSEERSKNGPGHCFKKSGSK